MAENWEQNFKIWEGVVKFGTNRDWVGSVHDFKDEVIVERKAVELLLIGIVETFEKENT